MTSVNTLLSGLSLRAFLSHQGTTTTRVMAFPRINCRTTTATVLTATVIVTLCFVCVCLCFLLSHLLSQDHRRQTQLSDFVETKKYWTLPKSFGSQSSEWEERKKSRGKRGSLCARRRSRKTVTCHGLCVVEPVYIRPYCAADGGTGGELRGRASLVTVDVLPGHICSVSLCLYVPLERDKYVWLVQSRRRPVDWDLEGGLTRECYATFCVSTLFSIFFHKSTGAGFFTEPLTPNTGKLCEKLAQDTPHSAAFLSE